MCGGIGLGCTVSGGRGLHDTVVGEGVWDPDEQEGETVSGENGVWDPE